MRERVLRDFFLGKASAARLSKNVEGARRQVGDITWLVSIEDMEAEFTITRPMLVALCDAVLAGEILPHQLKTIGFALLASDHFSWDDDLVSDITADWSAPEINYALTLENVAKFKRWLLGTEQYPPKPSPGSSKPRGEGERPYEIVYKKPTRTWWRTLAGLVTRRRKIVGKAGY